MAESEIVAPESVAPHGDHRLYRCQGCKSILTYRETLQGPDGCRWCGSLDTKYATWVTDKEFEYAVRNGFDPIPDGWQYRPGNPGD